MIIFGTQYYRPPFPNDTHWEADIKAIKDAGMNCMQLWVVWGWVEAVPGRFNFSDYDRLIELAEKNGLKVVLSLIAELQPTWINHEIPNSELVNHLGQKIISGNRGECHYGITPGGCIDHPDVWGKMSAFIAATVQRYKAKENLAGWDIWNELRWNVHAESYVCYCSHTISSFRHWLDQRFCGLDGLNKAWQRRYSSWEEVQPGRVPNRPYTETMAFLHFLTWRANQHANERYTIVKSLDQKHLATVHGPAPCHTMTGGGAEEQTLNRGNDWFYADEMDRIGCSNFPTYAKTNHTDYAIFMEAIRSAAGDKKFWISELQGGRSNKGFHLAPPGVHTQ